MNRILFRIFIALAALHLGLARVQAQISVQRLTFSLVGQYQTNVFSTNSPSDTNWTEEHANIHPILITTGNIIRSLAVDNQGTNFREIYGGTLIREVDLNSTNEGIFIRKGTNLWDVSSNFGNSYVSNFTGDISNAFPGYASNISDQPTTNLNVGSVGPIPQTTLFRGYLSRTSSNTIVTNYLRTTALHSISFNTANVKFNLVGVGQGNVTEVSGSVGGTNYKSAITWENSGCAGTYYLNITTNVYTDSDTNIPPQSTNDIPPQFITGPMQGSFNTLEPQFSTNGFGVPFK